MKKYITLSNIQWLIIVILIIMVIFYKEYRKCTSSVQTIQHTDTIYKDTGKIIIKMKMPVPIIKTEIQTEWKTLPVDTAVILQKYFNVVYTMDSVDGPDIKGTLEEAISQNTIINRKLSLQNTRETVINTTFVNEFKWGLYFGGSGYFGGASGIGPSLQFVTKKQSFGGGYDLINKQVRVDYHIKLFGK